MLKAYFTKWLFQYKGTRPFIVPLKFAYAFAALNFLFLLIAFTYSSNILLLYLFLLISIGLSAMGSAHFNLSPISADIFQPKTAFAGEDNEIQIRISNSSSRALYDLTLQWAKETSQPAIAFTLQPHSNQDITLNWKPKSRGRQSLPVCHVYSYFPYRLFNCWKYFSKSNLVLVHPDRQQDHLKKTDGRTEFEKKDQDHSDFHGHRNWSKSDSFRHIDWRAKARTGDLLVQMHTTKQPQEITLKWQDTDSLTDTEHRLEQMSFWIDQAVRSGFRFRVIFENATESTWGHGPSHADKCLIELATLHPKEVKPTW